ncbi:MAG TPA: hypothetical protein VGA73_03940 [Candidatus Binatia bacterium]
MAVYLSVLLHEIARWVVPLLQVPPEIQQRAAAGLLTPADCRLIAEKLDALGRGLAAPADVEEARRLGRETVEIIRLAEEDGELRECLKNLHRFPEARPRRAYLGYFLSRALGNQKAH